MSAHIIALCMRWCWSVDNELMYGHSRFVYNVQELSVMRQHKSVTV